MEQHGTSPHRHTKHTPGAASRDRQVVLKVDLNHGDEVRGIEAELRYFLLLVSNTVGSQRLGHI